MTATSGPEQDPRFISAEHLIPKRTIYMLEANIKKQVFPGYQTEVSGTGKLHPSAQYTPEKLTGILPGQHPSGIKNLQSNRIYIMFRRADWSFPEPQILSLMVDPDLVTRKPDR